MAKREKKIGRICIASYSYPRKFTWHKVYILAEYETHGQKVFVHKNKSGEFVVSEVTTGAQITRDKTKKGVVEKCEKMLDAIAPGLFEKQVAQRKEITDGITEESEEAPY